MNSLEIFKVEYKKFKSKATSELIIFFIIFVIGFIEFEPLIMLLMGERLEKIFGNITSIVIFGLYPILFILWGVIFSAFAKRNRLNFVNKVYPGFSEIKHREFKKLDELKAKDRVGNIINERLVIKTVNDKKKIFKDARNGIVYGLECLVGRFKLQVYEGKFYKQDRNETDIIFQGLVVVITEPDKYDGSELIKLLDEYALRKQNGALKTYDNGTFYTNTYKCNKQSVMTISNANICMNGTDRSIWEGCLIINEIVTILRTF